MVLEALVSVAFAVGAPVERHELLGYSVRGRPIRAHELGDPASDRRVLVVGCIHGNECAGTAVTRLLARGPLPTDADLWVVHHLNPDGFRLGVRQNARGVDLNRNFPAGWQPIGQRWDPTYSGPQPLSEPESRIARRFILRVQPALTIWFHQPQTNVRAWNRRDSQAARRYAGLVGLPFRRLPVPPGAATRWQRQRFPESRAFVVELPPGPMSPRTVTRHAAAIRSLMRSELAISVPASRIASSAFSESPGSTSTPRTASSITVTSNPSFRASRTLALTQ
jgi:protein MpaA